MTPAVHIHRRAGLLAAAVILTITALPSTAAPPARDGAKGFAIRGVVAGSYGSVWSHAERMDMLRWLGAHGMNTFVWGPWEDVKTSWRWREPYSDAEMAQFAEEIRLASSVGVRWGLLTHPGRKTFPDPPESQELCFSCPGDFETLAAKYERFHELGARVFMISFGDSVKTPTRPEDVAAFGIGDAAVGRMHASFANHLQERLPGSVLIFSPSDYSGTKGTEYLAAVAETLSSSIVVNWSGPGVFSPNITGKDADAFAEAVSPAGGPRRRVMIWDNYPTNDIYGEAYSSPEAGGGRIRPVPSLILNFGPLKGRGADLVGRVEGLLSNPMNQPEASKVALYTVAAYVNNPSAYTQEEVSCASNPGERTRAGCLSEAAWLEGIKELGGQAGEELLDVVSQMRSALFDRTESPAFVARRDAFAGAFDGPWWEAAWSALRAELVAEREAGRTLRAGGFPSYDFVAETANHLDTLELNTRAGILAADMLTAQRPTLRSLVVDRHGLSRKAVVRGVVAPADPAAVARLGAELLPAEEAMRTSPFAVHGTRVFTDLNGASALENRMDEFLDWARATTAGWVPAAPLAAAGPLNVTVEGDAVPVAPDGSFSVSLKLPPAQSIIDVVVTDAAGFRTGRQLLAGRD